MTHLTSTYSVSWSVYLYALPMLGLCVPPKTKIMQIQFRSTFECEGQKIWWLEQKGSRGCYNNKHRYISKRIRIIIIAGCWCRNQICAITTNTANIAATDGAVINVVATCSAHPDDRHFQLHFKALKNYISIVPVHFRGFVTAFCGIILKFSFGPVMMMSLWVGWDGV